MLVYVRMSNEVSSPNDSDSPLDSSNGSGSAGTAGADSCAVATENTSKMMLRMMLPRHIVSRQLASTSVVKNIVIALLRLSIVSINYRARANRPVDIIFPIRPINSALF